MADQIRVSFGSLEAAVGDIAAGVAAQGQRLADLKADIAPMVATWEGAAQAAYQGHQAKWDSAWSELTEALQAFQRATDTANTDYRAGRPRTPAPGAEGAGPDAREGLVRGLSMPAGSMFDVALPDLRAGAEGLHGDAEGLGTAGGKASTAGGTAGGACGGGPLPGALSRFAGSSRPAPRRWAPRWERPGRRWQATRTATPGTTPELPACWAGRDRRGIPAWWRPRPTTWRERVPTSVRPRRTLGCTAGR